MQQSTKALRSKPNAKRSNLFQLKPIDPSKSKAGPNVHIHGAKENVICETESLGYPRPKNRSPAEIVVDASAGFIPLWAKNVTLRWRFNENSLSAFQNPQAVKDEVKNLMGRAMLEWGDAAPVKFSQNEDLWDFEVVVRNAERCNMSGCVLASAFFPDGGTHELVIYPTMFEQSPQEQLETLAHEIGHIFGLRHFFANISETDWPSEIFGQHKRFSIMNYGADSRLTDEDKADLKRLYVAARSGALTNINGTPIRLYRPFSDGGTFVVL